MNRRCFIFIILTALAVLPGKAFPQTAETNLLTAAQQAFNDGFSDVASRYLEDFLDKFPESPRLPEAKLLLGQCDFLRGEYDKALGLFEDLSQQAGKKDEILFWRAETYLKQDRWTEARRDYQSVIQDFPRSVYAPQALYSLGWSFFQKKEFASAKRVFGRLEASFPNHPLTEDATLKMAQCDYNAGLLKDAVHDFQRYQDKYPKSAHLCDVNFNMAESLYDLGRFEAAEVHYKKALGFSCEDAVKLAAYTDEGWNAIKLGKFNDAQGSFKRAENLAGSKGLSADEAVLGMANLAYEQEHYAQALTLFTAFIKDYPSSDHWSQGYLGRANVLYVLKRYEDARLDYLHLLDQKDPETFEKCRFGLGWCEFKLGRTAGAVGYFQEVFDHALGLDWRADALIQMADVYQESGQWEAAAAAYQRVVKNYPNNEMMDYCLYRQAIAFLKSAKTDAALRNFQLLQEEFPASKYLEDMDYYMGVAAFKKGDYIRSIRNMRHYLKDLTRPSEFTPEANYILALSYLNARQPDEALKVFQKILRVYPNDVEIAKNADIGIAKCQFELGQDREAVKRFKLIVYKYPGTQVEFEALLWLAQYYLKNGDADSAVEYYKSILDGFPDSPQVDQIHYELGQAYEMEDHSDDALQQYQSIPARDEALKGKTRLAVAGIMAKDMDPHRAIAAYESIIAANGDYAGEAYVKLGQIYRNMQDYEKELEVYRRALAAGQGTIDRAQTQFNLADTLELMGTTDQAVAEYLKIPDLYPNEPAWTVKAYLRVAKIYEEGKDWEGARVTYQKIIQMDAPEASFAKERLDWIKNNAGKAGIL